MSEVLIPPWIIPEEESQEWLDEGSSVFNAAFSPGLAQRQSYGGLRLKLSRKHTVRGEEKAQLLSILKSTKGRYNALRTKVHFALRGAFPASELLTNNTFANGTTGWTAQAATLSVVDRALRISPDGSNFALSPAAGTPASMTQYVPYVLRSMLTVGPKQHASVGPYLGQSGGALSATGYGAPGYRSAALVPYVTGAGTAFAGVLDSSSGYMAGDYFECPWASLSRCALVDNGQNLLLRSDELDNAAWSSLNASVTANNAVAPDGSNNGEDIVEDNASGDHARYQQLSVASSVVDYAFSVALKAGDRSFAYLDLYEATGGTVARQYFNLSTGAVGSNGATGVNWSNRRAFSTSLGGGWYRCTIVARKTNAATTLRSYIGLATADGTSSYTGNGTAYIRAWRATLAQSSVPTRLGQTTATASTGTSQTGPGYYTKGWPASTNGLLLPDDIVEINGEIKTCTAALNSDAAGLGYLQFEPAMIRAPADNDPIIITDPMGKFLVSNLKVDNEFGTQAIVTYDLEHIYE